MMHLKLKFALTVLVYFLIFCVKPILGIVDFRKKDIENFSFYGLVAVDEIEYLCATEINSYEILEIMIYAQSQVQLLFRYGSIPTPSKFDASMEVQTIEQNPEIFPNTTLRNAYGYGIAIKNVLQSIQPISEGISETGTLYLGVWGGTLLSSIKYFAGEPSNVEFLVNITKQGWAPIQSSAFQLSRDNLASKCITVNANISETPFLAATASIQGRPEIVGTNVTVTSKNWTSVQGLQACWQPAQRPFSFLHQVCTENWTATGNATIFSELQIRRPLPKAETWNLYVYRNLKLIEEQPEAFLNQSTNAIVTICTEPHYCQQSFYALDEPLFLSEHEVQSITNHSSLDQDSEVWNYIGNQNSVGSYLFCPATEEKLVYNENSKTQRISFSPTYQGAKSVLKSTLLQPLDTKNALATQTNMEGFSETVPQYFYIENMQNMDLSGGDFIVGLELNFGNSSVVPMMMEEEDLPRLNLFLYPSVAPVLPSANKGVLYQMVQDDVVTAYWYGSVLLLTWTALVHPSMPVSSDLFLRVDMAVLPGIPLPTVKPVLTFSLHPTDYCIQNQGYLRIGSGRSVRGRFFFSRCDCRYPFGGEICSERASAGGVPRIIQTLFLVLSNLFMAWGIYLTIQRHLYGFAASLFFCMVNSMFYHLCDLEVACILMGFSAWQNLDVFYTYITVLNVACYLSYIPSKFMGLVHSLCVFLAVYFAVQGPPGVGSGAGIASLATIIIALGLITEYRTQLKGSSPNANRDGQPSAGLSKTYTKIRLSFNSTEDEKIENQINMENAPRSNTLEEMRSITEGSVQATPKHRRLSDARHIEIPHVTLKRLWLIHKSLRANWRVSNLMIVGILFPIATMLFAFTDYSLYWLTHSMWHVASMLSLGLLVKARIEKTKTNRIFDDSSANFAA